MVLMESKKYWKFTVLPISNAEVERGFSSMYRIKTYSRNRLLTGILENLMMISLNGDDLPQWDPTESINSWVKIIISVSEI